MYKLAQQVYTTLGIQLTPAQLNALEVYENEILKWNTRMNLTAIHKPNQIRVKHFLDSLTCMLIMDDTNTESVVDIGTGAGFPGLPLKIINPSLHLTLVESVGKKAAFCRHIVRILGLTDVEVIHDRAEVVGQMPDHRQNYDWAVARAVAILPALVEYSLPLLHVGGTLVAMKGEDAHAEVHSAEHATNIMGGHLRKLVPVTLPGVAEERYLVVIDKVAATPDAYPRRSGIPTKRPIKVKK